MSENPKRPACPEGWIVGVGASAGGLEALTQFVANLPPDFKHPIVIAQHLAPHVKSMMVDLLSRQSRLPVVPVKDRAELLGGYIYITPPNFDIEIDKGIFQLTVAGEATRPKPSIDTFFQSLARGSAHCAVGIILSGTGSDGSEGVRAIRSAGGITIAQDDRSAKYDGMPRSAVDTGSVDTILSPEAIAQSLNEIIREHESRSRLSLVDEQTLKPILELVRKKLGTDFAQYKISTIQRRIAKRMATLSIESFDEFRKLLDNTPAEIDRLAQDLLVSVTSFFRDKDAFDDLTREVDAIVRVKRTGDELRAWVAGCATGEEAYSVAMLLLDAADRHHKNLLIKVFATDLDADALFEGRNGIYSEQSVQQVPEDLRQKYFINHGNSYEVTKRLRDVVVFAKQDLANNPPFVKIDLVTCRNVLIYFENVLQKRTLEIFHYALSPGGVLLLGKSEGISAVPNLFGTVHRGTKMYRKLDVPSPVVPVARVNSGDRLAPQIPSRRQVTGPSLAEQAYERVFRARRMSAVVIDDEGTVLQILGDVSPYLGFHTGQLENKLQNLLPRGIGVEIPILIRRTRKENKAYRSRVFISERMGAEFTMVIRPLYENRAQEDAKTLFVVNFEPRKVKKEATARAKGNDIPQRVVELEQELYVTREHLQTVIEELGISNEELQSLNEELSSTNEELQASGEELETTNEELQSTNEELTTLNEQLSTKSAELRAMNASLENVQSSIGSPLILIDQFKRVVRYNNDSLKVFNFSAGDIGRPIARVSANCELPDFEDHLTAAIENGQTSESIVEAGNGVFQMRVMPCFDEGHSIVGAILIFLDNSELIRSRERIKVSESRIRSIVDGSSSLVFLKDPLGRYLLVNRQFCEYFGVNQADVLGRTDRELFGEKVGNQLRDADLEVLFKRKPLRREERIELPDGEAKTFLINRFLLSEQPGSPEAIGAVATDMTDTVRAQEELARSEQRYRAIVQDQAVFVCRFALDGKLTFTNGPFETRFGEVKGDVSFYQMVHESERARIQSEMSLITSERPIIQIEHRMSSRANASRWVRWICRGIFAPDQPETISEYQAVGFDVTDLRNKADQLSEKDAIYSSIFNNTLDFLSVFRVEDGEAVLESFNSSAERSLGYVSGNLVGRRLSTLLSGRSADRILEVYQACINEKVPKVFEDAYQIFGEVRNLSTTLVPIVGGDGEVERIAALSRDITDYKRIESDLRGAKEAAEIANRSKSDFLASMSHELRTPLNVVLGMSQILVDTPLTAEQRKLADSVSRSGHVLLNLIDDVLDMAKIEAGKITLQYTPYTVQGVVEDVEDFFRIPTKNKGLQLRIETGKIDDVVMGDPVRLRQVLTNLIGNAVKFTDKGSITVKVDSDLDESGFRLVRCSVKDTGLGIAKADHHRLFQRFSQVQSGSTRRFGGSGLGLTICKQLVNMMDGEIGFKSEPGEGSLFWFTIRVSMADSETAQAYRLTQNSASHAATDIPDRPLKILAVDDNEDSQTVLELMLAKLQHQAVIVGSGADAVARLSDGVEYDLVLMDIQMPEMDGYQATSNIRKMTGRNQNVPIIALTANAMSGDAELCIRAGMDDYLTKPIKLQDLKSSLNRWARKIQSRKEISP